MKVKKDNAIGNKKVSSSKNGIKCLKSRFYQINRILPILFVLALFLPGVRWFALTTKNALIASEASALTNWPAIELNRLDPYPKNFEAYFNKHFGLRDFLLEVKNRFDLYTVGSGLVKNKIIVGKENWLFANDNVIPAVVGESAIQQAEIDALNTTLEQRVNYCKNRGIRYLLVLIPNKASIYPEFLPDEFQATMESTYHTPVEVWLNNLSDDGLKSHVYYLKDDFMKHKSLDSIYLYAKHDHHWNDWGAYWGSRYIVDRLVQSGVSLSNPYEGNEPKVHLEMMSKGNLSAYLGLESSFQEMLPSLLFSDSFPDVTQGPKKNYTSPPEFPYPWEYEKVYRSLGEGKPKVVIIRDSFARMMLPHFSAAFSESVYIWDNWQYALNEAILEQEHPDLVIQLVVEKHLLRLAQVE